MINVPRQIKNDPKIHFADKVSPKSSPKTPEDTILAAVFNWIKGVQLSYGHLKFTVKRGQKSHV